MAKGCLVAGSPGIRPTHRPIQTPPKTPRVANGAGDALPPLTLELANGSAEHANGLSDHGGDNPLVLMLLQQVTTDAHNTACRVLASLSMAGIQASHEGYPSCGRLSDRRVQSFKRVLDAPPCTVCSRPCMLCPSCPVQPLTVYVSCLRQVKTMKDEKQELLRVIEELRAENGNLQVCVFDNTS